MTLAIKSYLKNVYRLKPKNFNFFQVLAKQYCRILGKITSSFGLPTK